MLLFLSVMVCTLSAQEKKGETIGERIVANAYNADSIRGILDKMPYFTLFKDNYFVQLGIKNVCLGPLSFRQRTAWLRQALRIPAVRAAVRDMPLQDARSRNDRIKLALLKVRLCAVVIALSSWNNRR